MPDLEADPEWLPALIGAERAAACRPPTDV